MMGRIYKGHTFEYLTAQRGELLTSTIRSSPYFSKSQIVHPLHGRLGDALEIEWSGFPQAL